MNVDEYFIIPIELRPEELKTAHSHIDELEWSESQLPGTEEYQTYVTARHLPYEGAQDPAVHLALVDSSLCFVYHRQHEFGAKWTDQPTRCVNYLLARKRWLLGKVEGDISWRPVGETLGKLGVAAAGARADTYGFSMYVLTADRTVDESLVNDIMGLIKEPELEARRQSGQAPPRDIDSSSSSSVYVSYSAVVGASFAEASGDQAATVASLSGMLLRLELSLQAAWNCCHQAGIRVDKFLSGLALPHLNQDAVAIDQQEYFAMVRAVQIGRRAQSASGSGRERAILAELVRTSQLDAEVTALLPGLETLDKVLRRLNERRVEIGQCVIAGIFALFAGTGTTQAIFAPFDFARVTEAGAAIGVGVVAACLALWATRPGRKVLGVRTDTYPF